MNLEAKFLQTWAQYGGPDGSLAWVEPTLEMLHEACLDDLDEMIADDDLDGDLRLLARFEKKRRCERSN